jgi:hypothetical protein
MYKTIVKLVVVFGSETWVVIEMDKNRLGTGEREVLRRIHGLVVEEGMWRIRNNQELRDLYKDLDVVADIKKEELQMDWTCSKNGPGKDS